MNSCCSVCLDMCVVVVSVLMCSGLWKCWLIVLSMWLRCLVLGVVGLVGDVVLLGWLYVCVVVSGLLLVFVRLVSVFSVVVSCMCGDGLSNSGSCVCIVWVVFLLKCRLGVVCCSSECSGVYLG